MVSSLLAACFAALVVAVPVAPAFADIIGGDQATDVTRVVKGKKGQPREDRRPEEPSERKAKPSDPQGGASRQRDHDGDADADGSTTITEDTDTNDPDKEDVADDGDNLHPSGKDRSVEHGNSAANPNQGKAESDPDDDGRGPDRTNGGPDKPGGSGGLDLADQDGNNGCGNDDDFEDDNEGLCGSKRPDEARRATETCPIDTSMTNDAVCGDEVAATVEEAVERDGEIVGSSRQAAKARRDGGSGVLGVRMARAAGRAVVGAVRSADAVLGAALPFTGGVLTAYVAIGLGAIVTGSLITRRRGRSRA